MNFWKALEESIILQGLLTIMLACAVIYLAVTGQPVPEVLSLAFGTVIGYFFANKSSKVEQSRTERLAMIQQGRDV